MLHNLPSHEPYASICLFEIINVISINFFVSLPDNQYVESHYFVRVLLVLILYSLHVQLQLVELFHQGGPIPPRISEETTDCLVDLPQVAQLRVQNCLVLL